MSDDARDERLGEPGRTAQHRVLDARGAETPALGHDLEPPVRVPDRTGPGVRAVHEHAVAERHAAEPDLLLAHERERSARQSTDAAERSAAWSARAASPGSPPSPWPPKMRANRAKTRSATRSASWSRSGAAARSPCTRSPAARAGGACGSTAGPRPRRPRSPCGRPPLTLSSPPGAGDDAFVRDRNSHELKRLAGPDGSLLYRWTHDDPRPERSSLRVRLRI